MTDLPTLPIFGIEISPPPQFSLNGESITIRLLGPGETRVPLQISRDALSGVTSRLTRILLTADRIAQERGDPAAMSTVATDRVSAQAPYGAPFVALSVLTHLPLLQHFEVMPEQAETLATELQASARQARENAAASRN